jgi:hypothetical protein
MAKFTRRNFIKASAAGIVAGAVNLNGTSAAYKRGEATP